MSKETAVKTIEPREVATANDQSVTPSQLLAVAVQSGRDLDYVRELMQMEREWKADRAREAFYEAMAEFKKQPIEVIKDKINKQFDSQYSSAGNLINKVNAVMAPFGLNARYAFDQSKGIEVTCILAHTLGHSIEVPLTGPLDTSGAKNPLQQLKSTITYLEISTYQAVTGVFAIDAANLDDDGNAAGIKNKVISKGEEKELDRLIRLTNTKLDSFLKWAGSEKLESLPASEFGRCKGELMRKKGIQDQKLKEKEAAQ